MKYIILLIILCITFDQNSATNVREGINWIKDFNTNYTHWDALAARGEFAYETNITKHNEEYSTQQSARLSTFIKEKLFEANLLYPSVFSGTDVNDGFKNLPKDTQRQYMLLKLKGGDPKNKEDNIKLKEYVNQMTAIFSKGKVCLSNGKCEHLDPGLEHIISHSRNETLLKKVWEDWRDVVGTPIGKIYPKYVDLVNEGARDYGYKDASDLWIAPYEDANFTQEVDALWNDVKPLYEKLHCYVRSKLSKFYGKDKVPLDQPIPAHLLGNMWAQSWANIYPIVAPYPNVPSTDITPELKKQGYDARRMMDTGEDFYTSMGFPKLPPSFWKTSMITRPADRDVVCHGSTSDLTGLDEKLYAIKMCTKILQVDLYTISHELGHDKYFQGYSNQVKIYRDGNTPGVHEAIGDTVRLCVSTPNHLKKIGLLKEGGDHYDPKQKLINYQMSVALEKIAFLPFGLLIDKYRWKVFQGKIKPEDYNKGWWELRNKYQGLQPPVGTTRNSSNLFDAGAKFHTASNVPYIRYFQAAVLQFQFLESLCKVGKVKEPLWYCDIYKNRASGKVFWKFLQLGKSVPPPVALSQITGGVDDKMNAESLVKYFKPLSDWLDEQIDNDDLQCGW